MIVEELLDTLCKWVQEFRLDAIKAVNRNEHMNELESKCELDQKEVDALLVAFVNHVGMGYCVDYGLCTGDIKKTDSEGEEE